MNKSRMQFWTVQVLTLGVVVWSLAGGPLLPGAPVESLRAPKALPVASVPREKPLHVTPLHDDPLVVSDAELGDVLWKVLPRFSPEKRKPNFVEHALRIWGVDAKFQEPGVMSGEEMKEFLTDHAKYMASWGNRVQPLLLDQSNNGVAIRWGSEEGASVHHDHWLACLTEAGVNLKEPIFTPSHKLHTINDALQQALLDVKVDEREIEWSPLAFAMWIAPNTGWKNADGRNISFDLIAKRLMRGTHWGICSGTHRVYSLMALVRIDDEHKIFTPAMRTEVIAYLKKVRDQIVASQFADGHWPSNWADGAEAVKTPLDDKLYQKVIATGHHLEWLSIAPAELHPPREQIRKAAKWCVATLAKETPESAQGFYTFYSHVGSALAGWRKTTPAAFYTQWEKTHPPKKVEKKADKTAVKKPEPKKDAAVEAH